MKKIGILSNYGLEGSGSSVYVAALAHFLAKAGYEVHVVALPMDLMNSSGVKEVVEYRGEQVERKRMNAEGSYTLHSSYNEPAVVAYPRQDLFVETMLVSEIDAGFLERYLIRQREFLARFVEAVQPDVLLVNHSLFWSEVCSHFPVPYVVIPHGTFIDFCYQDLFTSVAEKGFQGAKGVIVLNQDVRSRLSRFVEDARVEEIPVGVDTDVFQMSEREYGLRSAMTYHGQLLRAKGVHHLIASLPFVWYDFANSRMIVLGAGNFEGEIEALIELIHTDRLLDFKLENFRIKHSGWGGFVVNMLKQYVSQYGEKVNWGGIDFSGRAAQSVISIALSQSRLAVIPSIEKEAFPMVSLEAMACGVMPLMRNHSGFKAVLKLMREAGFTKEETKIMSYAGYNVLDLPTAIKAALGYQHVLVHQGRHAEFRRRLRDFAMKFSWERVASEIIHFSLAA